MRARRLVAVASVAVGLVALSGCRSEPGVAAYVGDQRITEDAVTRILDELRDAAAPASGQPAPDQPADQPGAPAESRLPDRNTVVSTLVLNEVCQRLSAEKGYRPRNQMPVEQVSQQLGYPTDTTYPVRVAELYTCLSGLPTEQRAPTEQEMVELVKAGKKAGDIPPEVTVEQAATQLDGPQLRSALATRQTLAEAVEANDVTVNPRYRPLSFLVLPFNSGAAAVAVPLGEAGSDAVTDDA